uniref:Sentrin-specific protease n=1 Tax=Aceria tosichella TaxID=561515 RepID=A0A6G1SFU8_9ACAR
MTKCRCLYKLLRCDRKDSIYLSTTDFANLNKRLAEVAELVNEMWQMDVGYYHDVKIKLRQIQPIFHAARFAFCSIKNESLYMRCGRQMLMYYEVYHTNCQSAKGPIKFIHDQKPNQSTLVIGEAERPAASANIQDSGNELPDAKDFRWIGVAKLRRQDFSQYAARLYDTNKSFLLDMQYLVSSDGWLKGSTINHYFNLLRKRDSTVGVIDSLALVQRQGEASISEEAKQQRYSKFSHSIDTKSRIVLVPAILDTDHWYLIVVNIAGRSIVVYDSGNTGNEISEAHNEACAIVGKIVNGKRAGDAERIWTIETIIRGPKQDDGSSCGVFTLASAEYLSRRASLTYEQLDIPYFRVQLFEHVCTDQALSLVPGNMGKEEFTKAIYQKIGKYLLCLSSPGPQSPPKSPPPPPTQSSSDGSPPVVLGVIQAPPPPTQSSSDGSPPVLAALAPVPYGKDEPVASQSPDAADASNARASSSTSILSPVPSVVSSETVSLGNIPSSPGSDTSNTSAGSKQVRAGSSRSPLPPDALESRRSSSRGSMGQSPSGSGWAGVSGRINSASSPSRGSSKSRESGQARMAVSPTPGTSSGQTRMAVPPTPGTSSGQLGGRQAPSASSVKRKFKGESSDSSSKYSVGSSDSSSKHSTGSSDSSGPMGFIPGTNTVPLPIQYFADKFKSAGPANGPLRPPPRFEYYTTRKRAPYEEGNGYSKEPYDPNCPLKGCPKSNREENEVEAILSVNTKNELNFLVEFKGIRGPRWINFHVLRQLEPAWVLEDFLRGIFLFHHATWSRMEERARKIDANERSNIRTNLTILRRYIPKKMEKKYQKFKREQKELHAKLSAERKKGQGKRRKN